MVLLVSDLICHFGSLCAEAQVGPGLIMNLLAHDDWRIRYRAIDCIDIAKETQEPFLQVYFNSFIYFLFINLLFSTSYYKSHFTSIRQRILQMAEGDESPLVRVHAFGRVCKFLEEDSSPRRKVEEEMVNTALNQLERAVTTDGHLAKDDDVLQSAVEAIKRFINTLYLCDDEEENSSPVPHVRYDCFRIIVQHYVSPPSWLSPSPSPLPPRSSPSSPSSSSPLPPRSSPSLNHQHNTASWRLSRGW